MPIYEYKCRECNEIFSLLQSIDSTESDTGCPKCASKTVTKIVSSFCCSSGSDMDFSSSIPSGGFGGGG